MADLRIYVDDDYKALVKNLGNRLGMTTSALLFDIVSNEIPPLVEATHRQQLKNEFASLKHELETDGHNMTAEQRAEMKARKKEILRELSHYE